MPPTTQFKHNQEPQLWDIMLRYISAVDRLVSGTGGSTTMFHFSVFLYSQFFVPFLQSSLCELPVDECQKKEHFSIKKNDCGSAVWEAIYCLISDTGATRILNTNL